MAAVKVEELKRRRRRKMVVESIDVGISSKCRRNEEVELDPFLYFNAHAGHPFVNFGS